MFISFSGQKYWEVGDSVIQSNYPGCPAKVIEVKEERYKDTLYVIEIDAKGHPEAYDENGDPEEVKYCSYTAKRLEILGN